MKKLILLLSSAVSLLAQSASIAPVCPPAATPGATLVCSAVMSGGNNSSNGPASVQWTMNVSQPVGAVTVTAAGSAVTAQKSAANSNTTGISIVAALNGTQIGDGTLATINIPMPPTATCPAATPKCLTVSFSAVKAASIAGTSFPASAGAPVSVGLPSDNCDPNGDGQRNQADVTLEQNAVLNQSAGFDRNGDGAVDVVDIQIIINGARGAGCSATQ